MALEPVKKKKYGFQAFINYTFNIFCHSILIKAASPCSTGNCLEPLHIRMNHKAIGKRSESSGKHCVFWYSTLINYHREQICLNRSV